MEIAMKSVRSYWICIRNQIHGQHASSQLMNCFKQSYLTLIQFAILYQRKMLPTFLCILYHASANGTRLVYRRKGRAWSLVDCCSDLKNTSRAQGCSNAADHKLMFLLFSLVLLCRLLLLFTLFSDSISHRAREHDEFRLSKKVNSKAKRVKVATKNILFEKLPEEFYFLVFFYSSTVQENRRICFEFIVEIDKQN